MRWPSTARRIFDRNRFMEFKNLTTSETMRMLEFVESELQKRVVASGDLKLVDKDGGTSEITIVSDYISVVGSAIREEDLVAAHDIDVLVREDPNAPLYYRENIYLLVRRLLDPEKTGKALHMLYNPQGPHDGGYLPLFDLVLRQGSDERKLVKAEGALKLRLTGVGAMNSPRFAPAGLLVEFNGQRIMLDGGPDDADRRPDVWLITDAEGELVGAIRVAASKMNLPAPHVGVFQAEGLTISPRTVRHTNHETYGYLIESGDKKIVWAPEFMTFPGWADNADLMFAEAAGWDKPINFVGGVGGHAAATDVMSEATKHMVKRLILAHIGRPTIKALAAGEKLQYGEVGREGSTYMMRSSTLARLAERLAKARTLNWDTTYPIQKPSMTFYTDFSSVRELWDNWAKAVVDQEGSVMVSPKVDGLRTIIHYAGKSASGKTVKIYFADQDVERTDDVQPLVERIRDSGMGAFIAEGEFQVRGKDGYLSRADLMRHLAGKTEGAETEYIFLYEVLMIDGEQTSMIPFGERYDEIRMLARRLGSQFVALPQVEAVSEKDLKVVAMRMLDFKGPGGGGPPIEGIVTRQPNMEYQFGSTNEYAKTKRYVELKVKVVAVHHKANGWTYTGALRGDKDEEVILGDTFVSKEKLADVGETLNVGIEELEIKSDGTLAWNKPTPLGPDASRPAYTVEQAKSLAQRFGRLTEDQPKTAAVEGDEGGDTRGGKAEALWEDKWFEEIPKTGGGRFVYHHHWRGLTEDEAKTASDESLLQTSHSVHGDLRMETQGFLWGWTIFLGDASANKPDRVFELKGSKDHLQATPKLEQPSDWIDVGVRSPYVSEPGGVGATSQKWSKFFAVDHGTYRVGVVRQHAVELFLSGKHIDGKYVLTYAPVEAGKRVWLLWRPDDQKPEADTKKLSEVLSELHSKRQKWLVWSDGKKGPYFIDVEHDTEEILKALEGGADVWDVLARVEKTQKVDYLVAKAQVEKKYTFGVAYLATNVPGDPELDSHKEFITAEELQDGQWDYVKSGDRSIYLQHGMTGSITKIGEWVDIVAWPFEASVELTLPGRPTIKRDIPANSVWIGVLWNDVGWPLVKSGKIRGLSIGGMAKRRRIKLF
jgi:hypothetical protein